MIFNQLVAIVLLGMFGVCLSAEYMAEKGKFTTQQETKN